MDKNLVQIAVDGYKGNVHQYSVADSQEALREALIEMNGGSTKLDWRAIRDGKCNGMFTLIEEIITKTTLEGLPSDSPLFDYVDYKNIALGDGQTFLIDKDGKFVVSEIAEGTQGLRRQRLLGRQQLVVPTKLYDVKIYDELNRTLAGRIDFNEMIDKVSEAFVRKFNADICKATIDGFDGIQAPYTANGSFNAATLQTIVDHVEAATGEKAVIFGSKQACRKINDIRGAEANSAKEDLYNMGYYGHFGTNPVIALQNAHKEGSTDFVLNNDLYIVGSGDKFVKFVTEGETLIINGNPLDNADLSQEYLCAQRVGIATVMAEQAGVYKLS